MDGTVKDCIFQRYYDKVVESLPDTEQGGLDIQMTNEVYFIWKFRRYMTSYHQDQHRGPHYTLYSQISGCSCFHFLPLLVGEYISEKGLEDPNTVIPNLKKLEDMNKNIGTVHTLQPGEVMLIMPHGCHGVFVPDPALNPGIKTFTVSAIRAVELGLRRLRLEANNPMQMLETMNDMVRYFLQTVQELTDEVSLAKSKIQGLKTRIAQLQDSQRAQDVSGNTPWEFVTR